MSLMEPSAREVFSLMEYTAFYEIKLEKKRTLTLRQNCIALYGRSKSVRPENTERTREHSSRMHTTRPSQYKGSMSGGLPDRDPHVQRPTPSLDGETPQTETLLEGTWDQATRQEVTPSCEQTNRCKINTLPKMNTEKGKN